MTSYERFSSVGLQWIVRLHQGERLLVCQPFGWHLDGQHIPNAAEHFSREVVMEDLRVELVEDFGPFIAIVRQRSDDALLGAQS